MVDPRIRDWLGTEQQPADLYELLGRLRFDPDCEQLRTVLRAAYAELLPYQNHEDPHVAQRAMQLQMELGRGEDVLSDPAKLRAHHEAILKRLREAYAREKRDQEEWSLGRLRTWLWRKQSVHLERLEMVAAALLSPGDETIDFEFPETQEVEPIVEESGRERDRRQAGEAGMPSHQARVFKPTPLNYYQLLGLKPFTDDVATIRAHYQRMNARVRKYAGGPCAKTSRDLLNELAEAVLCLTDVQRKREYDASLGRKDQSITRQRTLEEILLANKTISWGQLTKAREYAEALGLDIRDALVQQKMAAADAVMLAYAESTGLPYIELEDVVIDRELVAMVPPMIARRYSCVPLMIHEGQLLMASPRPLPPDVEEELRLRFSMPVRTILCTAASINKVILEHYPSAADRPRSPVAQKPTAGKLKMGAEQQADRMELPPPLPSKGNTVLHRIVLSCLAVSAAVAISLTLAWVGPWYLNAPTDDEMRISGSADDKATFQPVPEDAPPPAPPEGLRKDAPRYDRGDAYAADEAMPVYTARPSLSVTPSLRRTLDGRHTFHGQTSAAWCVLFSTDGSTLATLGGRTVRLWDVATGELRRTLNWGGPYSRHAVAFSPDGSTLAFCVGAGGGYTTIEVWDLATAEVRQRLGESRRARDDSVTYNPDGSTLASWGGGWTVKLSDLGTGELRETLGERLGLMDRSRISSVAFSPDGTVLASAGAGAKIRLWNVATGELRRTLEGRPFMVVNSVAFSPDGLTLAAAGRLGRIQLWNVATGELRQTFGEPKRIGLPSHGAFSPDCSTLALWGRNATIELWSVNRGQLLGVLLTKGVLSVAFSPDGSTLACASADKTVRLWDLVTKKE